jgi:hypothetical protein
MIVGAAVLTTAGFGVMPAQAESGYYIGPDGVRVYFNDDNRPYSYTSCHNEVSYQWQDGEQMRVVDRVCYDRWGSRYVARTSTYPTGRYNSDWDD